MNIANIKIKESTKLKKILIILNTYDERIALVVNKKGQLIGTITDGDIRRAFLNNADMNEIASNIMNSKPVFFGEKVSKNEIYKFMIKSAITQIPILDKEKKIINLEIFKDIKKTNSIENSVVLMAGGYGKRLRPLTNNTPKVLLKLGNKPILEHLIDKFKKFGFKNFYISTYFKKNTLKKYFGNGNKFNVNITYLKEKKPLGTAGSLSLLPIKKISKELIIINGDVLSDINFLNLIEFHKKNKADVTVCGSQQKISLPYGILELNNLNIKKIEEKPNIVQYVNAGIYVFKAKILKKITNNNFLDMPDFINKLIEKKYKIKIYPIHEYWADIGQIDDYNKAKIKYDFSKADD